MRKSLKVAGMMAGMVFLLVEMSPAATNYYVATDGSDSYNGTSISTNEMGQLGVKQLMERIRQRREGASDPSTLKVMLPGNIVERASHKTMLSKAG